MGSHVEFSSLIVLVYADYKSSEQQLNYLDLPRASLRICPSYNKCSAEIVLSPTNTHLFPFTKESSLQPNIEMTQKLFYVKFAVPVFPPWILNVRISLPCKLPIVKSTPTNIPAAKSVYVICGKTPLKCPSYQYLCYNRILKKLKEEFERVQIIHCPVSSYTYQLQSDLI